MRFEPPIPVLRIFDWPLARGFYVDWLGFRVDWEHRFEPGLPLYAQVSRAGAVLHLSEHHGDATPGGRVLIRCEDVDALLAELSTRPYARLRPSVEPMPWQARRLELVDPFGNRLAFETPQR